VRNINTITNDDYSFIRFSQDPYLINAKREIKDTVRIYKKSMHQSRSDFITYIIQNKENTYKTIHELISNRNASYKNMNENIHKNMNELIDSISN